MPPDLILQAVPEFGPPTARRYIIRNLGTDEFWAGDFFTDEPTKARLYHTPGAACADMQAILKDVYGHMPLQRYTVPIEIEVYGDVPKHIVARWLHRASILNLSTHRHGNGPRNSLVLPVIYWGLIKEANKPLFALENTNDQEDVE